MLRIYRISVENEDKGAKLLFIKHFIMRRQMFVKIINFSFQ